MNVKELRTKKGVTQEELAVKTGIPRTRIAKWEQGLGNPKADDQDKLKAFFGELTGEEVHNGLHKLTEAQHAPDYRDDIIQLLKERINSVERQQLLVLKTNNALLKTVLQVLAKIQARSEKRKLEETLVELNNITELHLRNEKIGGS